MESAAPGALSAIAAHDFRVRNDGTGIHARPLELLSDDAHDQGLIQMLLAALLFVKSRSGVVSRMPAVA